MDRVTWIHADERLRDLRVLELITGADMQTDIGTDAQLIDNTWSMTLPESVWSQIPIRQGHYIYAAGTEWGGPVTMIRHQTAEGTVTLQGPTWRGLLHQKRILPPAGQGYLVFTAADANEVIRQVLGTSFGSLITATSAAAGVLVTASFRYQSMAQGLQKALHSVGLRLDVAFDPAIPGVVLSAQPVNDWTDIIEVSQDYGVDFTSQIGNVELANHCLALGSGELENRTVLNVYRVRQKYYLTQPVTLSDADIRTVLLDYPNAEDEEDLLKSALDRLQEAAPEQSITVDQLRIDVSAQLGDLIPVRDRLTGLVATSEISNRILSIQEGVTTVSVKVATVASEAGVTRIWGDLKLMTWQQVKAFTWGDLVEQ